MSSISLRSLTVFDVIPFVFAVLFSAQEPIPGYAPSLMGAIGLFSLVGAGLVKSVYLREDVHLDITPQDLGIKALCYYTVKGAQLYQQK